MSRSENLASRLVEGANALASYVEKLTPPEWDSLVPNEQRSVGTLVHHVAVAFAAEMDLAKSLAAGNPLVGVTWAMVDGMNAEHTAAHQTVPQAETIAMLRVNGQKAAEVTKHFTDDQLDVAVPISLYADAPLTVQFFIEDHPLRHSFHHLANIRDAVEA